VVTEHGTRKIFGLAGGTQGNLRPFRGRMAALGTELGVQGEIFATMGALTQYNLLAST